MTTTTLTTGTRPTTRMMRVRRPIAAATCAALVVLTACGDDDPEPLTKAEFTSQADAICAATNVEAEPLWIAFWEGFEDEPSAAGEELMFTRFDALLDDLAPITEQQIEDLRELEPPADDKELVEGLIDDFEAGVEEMNDLADRAVDGDVQAREVMSTEEGDPLAEVNAAARDYGLVVCGADG